MFNVSAILQQATEIFSEKSVGDLAETFDAGQVLDGVGLDSEFIGALPLDDPGELFSQLGIADALPVDPSILSAASDVLAGRGG